jgi:hypothetical protein
LNLIILSVSKIIEDPYGGSNDISSVAL